MFVDLNGFLHNGLQFRVTLGRRLFGSASFRCRQSCLVCTCPYCIVNLNGFSTETATSHLTHRTNRFGFSKHPNIITTKPVRIPLEKKKLEIILMKFKWDLFAKSGCNCSSNFLRERVESDYPSNTNSH